MTPSLIGTFEGISKDHKASPMFVCWNISGCIRFAISRDPGGLRSSGKLVGIISTYSGIFPTPWCRLVAQNGGEMCFVRLRYLYMCIHVCVCVCVCVRVCVCVCVFVCVCKFHLRSVFIGFRLKVNDWALFEPSPDSVQKLTPMVKFPSLKP